MILAHVEAAKNIKNAADEINSLRFEMKPEVFTFGFCMTGIMTDCHIIKSLYEGLSLFAGRKLRYNERQFLTI